MLLVNDMKLEKTDKRRDGEKLWKKPKVIIGTNLWKIAPRRLNVMDLNDISLWAETTCSVTIHDSNPVTQFVLTGCQHMIFAVGNCYISINFKCHQEPLIQPFKH